MSKKIINKKKRELKTEYIHITILLPKEKFKDCETTQDIKNITTWDDAADKIMAKEYDEYKFSHKNVQTTGTIQYDDKVIVLNDKNGGSSLIAVIYVFEINKQDKNNV